MRAAREGVDVTGTATPNSESSTPSAYVAAERQAAVGTERRRVARELHDTLVQPLNTAVMRLELARAALPPGATAAADHLTAAVRLVVDGVAEARRCLDGLRAGPGDGRGLTDALADLAAGTPGDGTRVQFCLSGHARPLPAGAEAHLLRIAQEAVANARRHAAATAVTVELAFDADGVRLRVADDGRGFYPATSPGGRCFGLVGLRERAAEVGGRLRVDSRPGGGTTVTVDVADGRGERAARLDRDVAEVTLLLPADQVDALDAAGRREGVTVATLIRRLVLDAAGRWAAAEQRPTSGGPTDAGDRVGGKGERP